MHVLSAHLVEYLPSAVTLMPTVAASPNLKERAPRSLSPSCCCPCSPPLFHRPKQLLQNLQSSAQQLSPRVPVLSLTSRNCLAIYSSQMRGNNLKCCRLCGYSRWSLLLMERAHHRYQIQNHCCCRPERAAVCEQPERQYQR